MGAVTEQRVVVTIDRDAPMNETVSCAATEVGDGELDLFLSPSSLNVHVGERLAVGFPNGHSRDVVVSGVTTDRVRVHALAGATQAGLRGAYRRAHAVPVVLLTVSPHSRLIFGTTVNVSTSGLAMLSPEMLDAQVGLGLRIDIDGRVVVGLATVLSTMPFEDRAGRFTSIARCKITEMTSGDRDWLSRFVLDMRGER
jgi:hypothetical protein